MSIVAPGARGLFLQRSLDASCNAKRFQSCLGTPCALDSEVRITVDEVVEVVESSKQVAATDEQVNDQLELAERDVAAIDVEEIHESQSPDEEERRMRIANEGIIGMSTSLCQTTRLLNRQPCV